MKRLPVLQPDRWTDARSLDVTNWIDPCPLQDQALVDWYRDPPASVEAGSNLLSLILAQHFCNFKLWGLEDEARRTDVDDTHIANVKRSIDRWNETRNDLIERIDEALLARMPAVDPAIAEQHSETAGQMMDRLSILSLKVWHMSRSAHTEEDPLAKECAAKAGILENQRADLARCVHRLDQDFQAGRRFFKVFRQFKSYGDPTRRQKLQKGSR